MDESGVPQRAAEALPRLADRGVTQAHDREPRQPGRNVDLDADHSAVKRDERCGQQGREHVLTLRSTAYLRLTVAATSDESGRSLSEDRAKAPRALGPRIYRARTAPAREPAPAVAATGGTKVASIA
jgi:hypothetical protein